MMLYFASSQVRSLAGVRFRLATRLLAALLPLSLLAPTFVCGAGFETARDGTACCRAMKYACHEENGGSAACCQRKSPAPVELAVTLLSRGMKRPQPLAVVARLPVLLNQNSWARPNLQPLALSGGHSPPGIPLFLLHAVLLI